jgi:hypothetical protein
MFVQPYRGKEGQFTRSVTSSPLDAISDDFVDDLWMGIRSQRLVTPIHITCYSKQLLYIKIRINS